MNRRLAAIALVALVGIVGFWLVWGAAAPPPAAPSGPPESITIGLEPNQVNSLVYIADEKGYFAQNGLAVTLKNYSSGAAAVDGMLAGEADLAMATEWVLAGQALAQRPVRTIASIDRFEQMYLLGRNDRGIRNTSDLKGTTIGLQRKTSAEFYLGRYLDLHGMAVRDVTLVDIAAPKLADALANGTVDAVVVWQPYAAGITDRMPTGLAVWPAESGQPAYCTAITTDAWLAGHPETARRFLAALARAETDVAENPAAAKALVEKRLNYDQRLSGRGLARAPVLPLPRPVARRRDGGRGPVEDREQPDERDGDSGLRGVHRHGRPQAGAAGRGAAHRLR